MKKIIFSLMLIIAIGCVQETAPEPALYGNGVTRELPDQVEAGQEAVVTLHIRLDQGQTFYIIEEAVPPEIVTAAEHDASNHIKLVDLQAPLSAEYAYTITVPSEPGTYLFSGSYALEGMDEAAEILGDIELIVK